MTATTAIDALIERLRAHYPDMSGLTVVSMTGRGRDFLHHLIHTRIGGLLPTILSFDEYRTRRIAGASGLTAVPEDEAFLHFHALRCAEKGRSLPPADTRRFQAYLALIAEFSVSPGELSALDRIGPEQLARIDGFFATMEAFRSRLAAGGFFYPPFESARFADQEPGGGEFFVGLPLMTPASERFFRRIPRDRLFVDAPLFGPCMPPYAQGEEPDYETALSLVRRVGVPERRSRPDADGISFSEVYERAALPALLAREIDAFLRGPDRGGEQLFIVPLDETLSFYLWECLFRALGGQVNFAPWLPFTHFAAAERLREAVRNGKGGIGNGLASARRDLIAELSGGWNVLDEADRSAFEAAITMCDELDRLRPLMGKEWMPLAEYLIASKKLRLRGKRSAPIQVAGLGDATGIPYGRAVILPMNSGIFPRKPLSDPYLNLIHLPRLYRTQYESDDLALRQFLSFGRTAHIAALYDEGKGEAPSAHFSFLATEFGRRAVQRRMIPAGLRAPSGTFAVENTDGLRERLRSHVWSFSALKKFFTCPCRLILEDLEGVQAPSCLEGEERANLLIGEFLHRLFAELKQYRPALERWSERFDDLWDGDEELRASLPDHAVRKAIVRSFLADIADWEKEKGVPLLFSDAVTDAELELTAPFGDGRYQLRGRIDRLQVQGEKQLIADLKYREKKKAPVRQRLAERLEHPDYFDDRFQLLIYAWLALHNKKAEPGRLDAAHLFLRPRGRGDYEGRLAAEDLAECGSIMERIAGRIDGLLTVERFVPNYRSEGCPYCPLKALCLKPDLYKKGGRSW